MTHDHYRPHHQKGFTLIELLVVIAVVAILAVVVIITLNPVELLRQSRDSNRVSDLSTIKEAVQLYIVDVANANIASSTQGYNGCYMSSLGANATTTAACGYFTGGYTLNNVTSTQANYRKVDGTGWLPVNFTQMSNGAPFANLPADPANDKNFFYAYAATSTLTQFELETSMESKKFGLNGPNDVVSKDGGNNSTTYEVGTTYAF